MEINDKKSSITQFYNNLKDDIIAADILTSEKRTYSDLFLENRCDFLIDQEVIQEYHSVNFESKEQNIQVDAWGFQLDSEADKVSLVLILNSFSDTEEISKQTLSEFRAFLMKGKRFFNFAVKNSFSKIDEKDYKSVEPLIDYIQCNKSNICSLLIIGITNSRISTTKDSLIISENTIQEIPCHYDIWDIERFEKIENSLNGRESVNINFVEDYDLINGIPMLPANNNCNDIASYLFILPGKILAQMYEKWNERLLEQNPRTFLQFTRKVNKKIRNTIINEPEKFFSYNNGLSAVASGISLNSNKNAITSVIDFQIVNGGQTTASIYNTFLKAKQSKNAIREDLVSVMVKLSVIENHQKSDEIIPKISEYSNTQNKVSASAFSAHHPFHKKIENYSRNVWTPFQKGGSESRWYYERVQGQYKNAIQLYQSASQKKHFKLQHPKNQVITKVELSKYLLTFESLPYIVCRGAQKCYAEFCKSYLKDKNGIAIIDSSINEEFFKESCTKAILFRSLEKKLGRGFRFVTTPYTLALVVYKMKEKKLVFDYKKIWNNQWKNEFLINILLNVADKVLDEINDTIPETMSILSEWGKQEKCWDNVKRIPIDITPFLSYCISENAKDKQEKEAQKTGKIDLDIDNVTYVYNKGSEYWKEIYFWGEKTQLLSSKDLSILLTTFDFKKRIPSSRQSKAIHRIEEIALREGFFYK